MIKAINPKLLILHPILPPPVAFHWINCAHTSALPLRLKHKYSRSRIQLQEQMFSALQISSRHPWAKSINKLNVFLNLTKQRYTYMVTFRCGHETIVDVEKQCYIFLCGCVRVWVSACACVWTCVCVGAGRRRILERVWPYLFSMQGTYTRLRPLWLHHILQYYLINDKT